MNSTKNNLSAIVLAGGLSIRMGRDKALISIAGVPLIQYICRVALQCTESVYIVSPWVERYQALIDQRVHLIQETPIPGEANSQTPLKGFAQGLTSMQTEWVLLLACDLPNLRADVLKAWASELEYANEKTIAFLPKNPEGWWEPLCGFYRVNCRSSLETFFEQGGRSFQHWLKHKTVQELALSQPTLLFNCNTLEDLSNLESKDSQAS
ncbi:MAG: molybdenum cofactor guanylyltransferase [Leptolyngbyaceae cyanobacterium CRU_2_3]|nr:molybdenum cofactor guanylyltransferase [Leptolyngbyaceae cyanobacterium CRU_2_3]